MEIDPESSDFGKILMDIPLPPDLVAHHIFFNCDKSKAYVTVLGKSILNVVALTKFPYRLRAIAVPDCQVGEDLVVSEDNKTRYLTCMGSSTVIMEDAVKDQPIKTVSASEPAVATILYIRSHPGTPKHVNVFGYFYDVDTGMLTEVVTEKAEVVVQV